MSSTSKKKKEFLVNDIPFEVHVDVYNEYFIMSEVSQATNDMFQDVDGYEITVDEECKDPEDEIKTSISAIINALEKHKYVTIDPFTGCEMCSHIEVSNVSYGDWHRATVNTQIVIEFLDKYMKDPIKVICIVSPPVKIYHNAFCDNHDKHGIIKNRVSTAFKLLLRAFDGAIKLEDNTKGSFTGKAMIDKSMPCYIKIAKSGFNTRENSAEILRLLYLMIACAFKKYEGIPTFNYNLDDYIEHYLTAEYVLDVNKWGIPDFVPPSPQDITQKIEECEQYIRDLCNHRNND